MGVSYQQQECTAEQSADIRRCNYAVLLTKVGEEKSVNDEASPMNPTVNSTEEPRRMSCLNQLTPIKKGLIALGVLACIAVAVILGVTISNPDNPDNPNAPPSSQIWTGMCIECQNQACDPGEKGVSIQCPKDTVACINGTGTAFTRRHCGSKDKLSDGLVMNDCVVMNGDTFCACNTNDCNKET